MQILSGVLGKCLLFILLPEPSVTFNGILMVLQEEKSVTSPLALLENYDRQTHRPTNQLTDQPTDQRPDMRVIIGKQKIIWEGRKI